MTAEHQNRQKEGSHLHPHFPLLKELLSKELKDYSLEELLKHYCNIQNIYPHLEQTQYGQAIRSHISGKLNPYCLDDVRFDTQKMENRLASLSLKELGFLRSIVAEYACEETGRAFAQIMMKVIAERY